MRSKISYLSEKAAYFRYLSERGYEANVSNELNFESLPHVFSTHSLEEILEWYEELKNKCPMRVTEIPLDQCRHWYFEQGSGSLRHDSGEFYAVKGYRVEGSASREVTDGWDQPLLTQVGYDGGILGLLRKKIDGVPHYLVEAKVEPGNYNLVQISTTLQATFSNIKRSHRGRKPHFCDLFTNPADFPITVLLDQWMSEDGGRLYNKRNRSMLLEYSEEAPLDLPNDQFKWITLYQLKTLIRDHNAIVAPHIRGIISAF
tara:strand:+ start:881 stop:1657 length:777 start_codon:yes stop_codon:yes gene_type:complete